jgi:hypothetical protein
MIVRWVIVLAFLLGLVVTVLELSAGSPGRAPHRRAASVADVVTGRGADASVPEAPEGDETAGSASPTISY